VSAPGEASNGSSGQLLASAQLAGRTLALSANLTAAPIAKGAELLNLLKNKDLRALVWKVLSNSRVDQPSDLRGDSSYE
jgi:hypothetical protein